MLVQERRAPGVHTLECREHGIMDDDVQRFGETLKRIAQPRPKAEKPDH
jgi:hypothetical protein